MVFVNVFRQPVGQPMTYINAKVVPPVGQTATFPGSTTHAAPRRRGEMAPPGSAADVRQRLLGHVSAASMQPYVHPTDEEKRAAIERAAVLRQEIDDPQPRNSS